MPKKETDLTLREQYIKQITTDDIVKQITTKLVKLEHTTNELVKEMTKINTKFSIMNKPKSSKTIWTQIYIIVLGALIVGIMPSLFEFIALALKQ